MDEDLLRRAQARDHQALSALTEQMAPLMKRFALQLCKHPDTADDTAQEALLSFAARLDEFEGRAALSTWAYTLARTACTRQRRGLKNAPGLPLDALPDLVSEQDPEASAAEQEISRLVNEAIDSLPPDAQGVLRLRDIEGLDTREACERLGLTPEALKSRLHRARVALAARLLQRSPELHSGP